MIVRSGRRLVRTRCPEVAARLSIVQYMEVEDRLRKLRKRLQLGDNQRHPLPSPPLPPTPANSVDTLTEHGLFGSERVCTVGDTFLHAIAVTLGLPDPQQYARTERAVVVGALAVCQLPTTFGDTEQVAWQQKMNLDDQPFDELALLLWCLLNNHTLLILGGRDTSGALKKVEVRAHDDSVSCACVGLLHEGRWVGISSQHACTGTDVSVFNAPPTKRMRIQPELTELTQLQRRNAADADGPALPLQQRSERRDKLIAEAKGLRERLRAISQELLQDAPPDCLYLVRHPLGCEDNAALRHWNNLEEPAKSLVVTQGWYVVGFGRSRFVFNAYDNGRCRLHGEFFAHSVAQSVGYQFNRKNVLVWREQTGADARSAQSLETLLKAVATFARRAHTLGKELHTILCTRHLFCSLDHPACATNLLGGWMDETLAMHPALWNALLSLTHCCGAGQDGGASSDGCVSCGGRGALVTHPNDDQESLLKGGRLLRCVLQQLKDTLLPEEVLREHEKLHGAWVKRKEARQMRLCRHAFHVYDTDAAWSKEDSGDE